jgi:hypothetical protein
MHSLKYLYILILMLLLQVVYGCSEQPAGVSVVGPAHQKAANINSNKGLTDGQQFRRYLVQFKNAVKTKNTARLTRLFNFPLQTTPQWSNQDIENSKLDPKEGLISQKDFSTYFNDIFTADVIKLIPASGENDLSEIDKTTTENYYKTLQQITDNGSTLYELQKQYAQDNGSETSFGFVFGKVGGNYKAISYYRPWPLK